MGTGHRDRHPQPAGHDDHAVGQYQFEQKRCREGIGAGYRKQSESAALVSPVRRAGSEPCTRRLCKIIRANLRKKHADTRVVSACFFITVSKDGGTFQNRIAASESSAFCQSWQASDSRKRPVPNTPRTDRGIDIEPWSRPAFSCAPCNASQQSELPAELEASFAHTAIHQRLYARLDSVASAIFTDQRTEKAGESEKQLPGFVVLGFSPDLTPAEYEKILSAAESRHDRTHRKSRLLGNDFPDFDPSIRAVGALYIQGNGPFAGLRIAVNGAGFVGSGPVAEIPAPLLDLSS